MLGAMPPASMIVGDSSNEVPPTMISKCEAVPGSSVVTWMSNGAKRSFTHSMTSSQASCPCVHADIRVFIDAMLDVFVIELSVPRATGQPSGKQSFTYRT
jgi:hypothetical protein